MFFALRMAMSIIMTVYSATPSGSYVMWVTVIPIRFAYAMSMWSYPMVRVDIMRTPPSLKRSIISGVIGVVMIDMKSQPSASPQLSMVGLSSVYPSSKPNSSAYCWKYFSSSNLR